MAGLLSCAGLLTATALVPPAAGGVSPPLPPGLSDLSAAAALAPPATGGAGLLARSPFAGLAAAAASLVPPAADGMGPLFRCSRRASPAATALAPPAAGGAGPARSPSPVLLLVGSPAELPLSPRSTASSATALLSCCLAFAARISPWLRAGQSRTLRLFAGRSSARFSSLAPPMPPVSPSASRAAPPACEAPSPPPC